MQTERGWDLTGVTEPPSLCWSGGTLGADGLPQPRVLPPKGTALADGPHTCQGP